MTLAPIKRDYRLHELSWQEFEHLATQICLTWLGEGFTPFAPGKDGGRDGKFNGKANSFPSVAKPLNGRAVLQAKHTNVPDRSCSDKDFTQLVDQEKPKIKRLIQESLCEHYLIFTNRKYSGGADEKIIKELEGLGLKSAHIIGVERLKLAIDTMADVRSGLPNRLDAFPFRFNEGEAAAVVAAFHNYIEDAGDEPFDSAHDFQTVALTKKNKLNNLSSDYYQHVIVPTYMPHFDALRSFLENPRNSSLAGMYHDAADELKQKLIAEQDSFETFDNVLISLTERIQQSASILSGKRRLVSVLVHYMYCNCDIGKRMEQTSDASS